MDITAAPTALSRSSRIAIAVAIGAAALFGSACSSAAEITATTADTNTVAASSSETNSSETSSSETSPADTAAAPVADASSEYGDLDCRALHEARMGIQGSGGTLIYAEDAEFVADVIGGPDAIAALLADVETLRPFQDVDAVPFGPIREGLDNFQSDLAAATDGRFGDITGGYKAAGINGLMAELGC